MGMVGKPCRNISGATGEDPVHSIPLDLKAQCGSGDQRSGALVFGGPVFRRCYKPPGSSQLNLPSQHVKSAVLLVS